MNDIRIEKDQYIVKMTNKNASYLFGVEAVKQLPEADYVLLTFNEEGLLYITLSIPLPSHVSHDGSTASMDDIVKQIAKDMGYAGEIIRSGSTVDLYDLENHEDNTFYVSRGTFELKGCIITISLDSNKDSFGISLYSHHHIA